MQSDLTSQSEQVMVAKCPYDDKECPKLTELEKDYANLKSELDSLKTDIQTLSRYLYLIIGMIAINWGINIW